MATSDKSLVVSIKFNALDWPLNNFNTIDFIHIAESKRLYLPMLIMQLQDTTKFLTRNNLILDGTIIQIGVKKENNRKTYTFRLFSCREILDAGSTKYKISGYWNLPTYWSKTLTKPYSGSSSSVLNTLATEVGLIYNGIQTADVMNWLPMNKTYKEFVTDISTHGFVDSKSCTLRAVTTNNELRYKNISEFLSYPSMGDYAAGVFSATQDPITDYKIMNKGGFFNSVGGYQSTTRETSLLSDEKVYSTLDVNRNSKQLTMNSAIKETVTQGRVRFSPPNSGNVHPYYQQAAYQNKRQASLFSFGIEVVTPMPVKASLFDQINLSVSVPSIERVSSYSGKYLLISKVVYVTGVNYYEKMELVRHGINSNANSTQV
jgi:hypothetical protein